MPGGAEFVLNLEVDTSIPICYGPNFGSHEDILLLEVDEKLLPDFLHQRVCIRGHVNEGAVLCLPSATYALKFVGTSNSVFLIPPGEAINDEKPESNSPYSASVIKLATGNMEVVHVAPKLDKLKALLAQNPYKHEEYQQGEDNYINQQEGLYRWEDLINVIQASDEELKAGLRALCALEINGYWRIVDENSMVEILTLLLHNSVLYDWPLSALKEDEVVATLVADGFPHEVALHCLDTYGHKERKGDECMWSLDEKRVCVHFARQILRAGKRKMEDFIREWTQRVPAGMNANFEMLEGEVLTEKIGVETWIGAFSVLSLPSTPAERFAALFHERQKWEWKDLHPYIRDLQVPGLSSEGLLIKYTRKIQPKAGLEPIFTPR